MKLGPEVSGDVIKSTETFHIPHLWHTEETEIDQCLFGLLALYSLWHHVSLPNLSNLRHFPQKRLHNVAE